MTKTNVPKLRFRGLNGEWNKKTLKDIAVKEKDKNSNGEYKDVLTNSAIYGVVDQKTFFDKSIANESNITGYYIVKTNDFVYNPRISVNAKFGPVNRNKLNKTGIVSPLYFVFKIKNMDLNFIDFFFKGSKWHQYIYKNGNSGARSDRVSISDSDFMDMPIIFPFKDEQQKIGSFFAKIDKLIELQTQKLEQLNKLKQGYLQKMFPQDGKLLPRLRFSGFSEKWKEDKLGNVYNINTGKSVYNSSNHGKYPIAGSTGIIGYDNEFDYEGNFLLVARVGDAGSTYCHSGKMKITDNTIFIDAQYENFLSGVLKNKNIKRLSVGSGRKLIKSSDLKKINVVLPDKKEQVKIDNFLSELNSMIVAQSNKIETLKQQKKAYLQKMFI